MDQLMPGFDREIARNAQRVLINPRSIDWHTGVLATKVTPGELRRLSTPSPQDPGWLGTCWLDLAHVRILEAHAPIRRLLDCSPPGSRAPPHAGCTAGCDPVMCQRAHHR